ncbi:MAG: hypothetical protein HN531_00955 [Opitutae bacterium]|jgi:hypothetical protein|nr:hypothetical protein [Opitutae bacterium]
MTKFYICVLLSFFGLVSSCRYQSGLGNAKGSETLFVQVVSNDTLLPQAGAIVSRTVREEFLRKGSFDLVHAPEEADLLLRVNLYEFNKSPEVFRADDTLLAAGFDMEVAASLDLYSSRKKSLVMDNYVVRANASALRENLTSQPAGRQPTMAIARELGLKIASRVSNYSW